MLHRIARHAAAALLLAAGAHAQGALTIPAPRGFVNDFAGVIQPAAVSAMESLARAVRDRSGGEITVVTLRDIGARDAGDVALQIGRDWKVGSNAAIGDARRNAGVVVLLVPKETSADGRGQISIQVGQGAEGFITDAAAGQIRREATEYFRRGDYSTGLLLITSRLAERYAAQFGFSLDSVPGVPARVARGPGQPQGFPPAAAILLFVVLVVLLTSSRRRGCGCLPFFAGQALGGMMSGRGGWSGGGFGGGFGGGGGGFGGFGGGGGFSGGGSSGSF